MVLFDFVWFCLMILYDCIWFYMIAFDSSWFYMIAFDSIWFYLILCWFFKYDSVWFYMILMIGTDMWIVMIGKCQEHQIFSARFSMVGGNHTRWPFSTRPAFPTEGAWWAQQSTIRCQRWSLKDWISSALCLALGFSLLIAWKGRTDWLISWKLGGSHGSSHGSTTLPVSLRMLDGSGGVCASSCRHRPPSLKRPTGALGAVEPGYADSMQTACRQHADSMFTFKKGMPFCKN